MDQRNKELLDLINKKRAAAHKKKFRLVLMIALIPTLVMFLYFASTIIYVKYFM